MQYESNNGRLYYSVSDKPRRMSTSPSHVRNADKPPPTLLDLATGSALSDEPWDPDWASVNIS